MSAQIIEFPTLPSLPEALKSLERRNRKKRPTATDDRLALLLLEFAVSRIIEAKSLPVPAVAVLLMARENLTSAIKLSRLSDAGDGGNP